MTLRSSATALVFAALLTAARAPAAHAQVGEKHLVGAVGTYSNDFSSGSLQGVAMGVEFFPLRSLAIGLDAIVLGGDDLGLGLSVDAALHFRRTPDAPMTPFLGVGRTSIGFPTALEPLRAWHARVGLNLPVSPTLDLRLEVVRMFRPDGFTFYRVGLTWP